MTAHAYAVREAVVADASACAAVYAPYVTGTAVSFESEPPSPGQMGERIVAAARDHAWLVLQAAGDVVGYAYGTAYSPRPAYRWTCEVSVYLAPGAAGRGGGRALYDALLPRLAARGYRTAVAEMTLPTTPASPCTARSASNRSTPTVGWGGSSAAGTTSPGCSGRSATATTRRPSPGDRTAR